MFWTILEKSYQHLFISLSSLFVALCIAIPLGFTLSRKKDSKMTLFIIRSVSLIQTIPGLAMLAAIVVLLLSLRNLISIPTTGMIPAVITLSLYGISPILTNTYIGITQVSPTMIDVATGLGMTNRQILFQVQVPHAIPTIIAGVRIAGVWTIGMCTLASMIGSGGLGDLILQGLRSMNPSLVIAGTLPAAGLAILFELFMSISEKWLTVKT